ncbi:MAG TPA: phosphatidate cytidylyltransferase [Bacteroidota bacterium]|nr:phosphatidate cytidylyltransferase [Bacteroidota bacterium]
MAKHYSNLTLRVAVAVIGIPALLFAAYAGGLFFFGLVAAIGVLALNEFYAMTEAKGMKPQRGTGIAGTVLIFCAFFHEQIQFFILPFFIDKGGISLLTKLQLFITLYFLTLVVVLLIELFRNKGSVILNSAATMMGMGYVGIFLGTLIGLRELYGMEFPVSLAMAHANGLSPIADDAVRATTYAWGGWTIISIFASLWMCDTMAYFGGRTMGRHKLFVRISPNKTWEGAVWGFVGAVAMMLVMRSLVLPYVAVHQAVVIGLIIGIFGQIGDLVESALKRDAGIKDSSSLIPGHGGVLDRFDSLIFTAPILYLYIDFVVLS